MLKRTSAQNSDEVVSGDLSGSGEAPDYFESAAVALLHLRRESAGCFIHRANDVARHLFACSAFPEISAQELFGVELGSEIDQFVQSCAVEERKGQLHLPWIRSQGTWDELRFSCRSISGLGDEVLLTIEKQHSFKASVFPALLEVGYPIWLSFASGGPPSTNRAFQKLFGDSGLTPEEKSWWPQSSSAQGAWELWQSKRGSSYGRQVQVKVEFDTRDSRYFIVGDMPLPFGSEDDRRGRIGVLVDITAMKKAKEQLRQANLQLTHSNLELQRFGYVASHDLQEPLRTIAGFCHLIQEHFGQQLDERGQRWLSFAVDGAKRSQQLVRDLLSYTNLESEQPGFSTVDMNRIFQVARSNLQRICVEQEAEVTCDMLPEVWGSGPLLLQLLQNLLSNALKFRREEELRIHVSCEERQGEMVFCVQDNGVGIDSENMERIFDVFTRLHSMSDFPGSGIGLSICRRVLDRHGGRVWVESELGQGSRFYFALLSRPSHRTSNLG